MLGTLALFASMTNIVRRVFSSPIGCLKMFQKPRIGPHQADRKQVGQP